MSFLDDFDAALESFEQELEYVDEVVQITQLIDEALNDIKHQRIVDTGKVTDWLLDIRQIING